MKAAAHKLHQVPIRMDVASGELELTGSEKLHLDYSLANGPVLTGNETGLLYLSRIINNLARIKEPGEHSHFYNAEPPLAGDSYPLTIYYEADAWFDRHAKKSTPSKQIAERTISPENLYAFVILDSIPPTLPISRQSVYPILSVEPYREQRVWIKAIRESTDRLYVLTLADDNEQPFQFGIDLDDPTVVLFQKENLSRLYKA